MKKKDYLKTPVTQIDITSFNASDIVKAMQDISFTDRDLAAASDIYNITEC
ncbi:MAG: hypothetical protein ABSB79_07605 [Syntrophales bacterium]|jgi:hypothetical protein